MKLRKHTLLLIITFLFASCYPRSLSTESGSNQPTPTHQAVLLTPSETDRYIGLIYPPIPNSIKTSTSWEASISPSSSSQDWSVAVVTDANNFMLWFSKTLYYDQNGKAASQVSDVAILPPPANDHVILVSACLLRGLLDPEIVVLAESDEESLKKRYFLNSNIVLAWRANQVIGKLERIETKDIECYAETFLDYP